MHNISIALSSDFLMMIPNKFCLLSLTPVQKKNCISATQRSQINERKTIKVCTFLHSSKRKRTPKSIDMVLFISPIFNLKNLSSFRFVFSLFPYNVTINKLCIFVISFESDSVIRLHKITKL